MNVMMYIWRLTHEHLFQVWLLYPGTQLEMQTMRARNQTR